MKRFTIAPRPEWRARVEEQGLLFHSVSETDAPQRYWAEGTYYELSAPEIDAIEHATGELHEMCLMAAQHVIDRGRYAELGIPAKAIPLIERAWEDEPPSIYGRMDFALPPGGVPKLLEYNGDTPTSLLEGAVIQWTWLEDCFPALDQYNSIHDKLIATWGELAAYLDGPVAHFGCVDDLEDAMTIGYLRDTATQAGLTTVGIDMEDIGWDASARQFLDLAQQPIRNLFKLYPWEGLITDDFAPMIEQAPSVRWLEPAWKMLISTKGILPILWELFPGHPNLLPASFAPLASGGWVKKPMHGREGSNVTIAAPGIDTASGGPYDSEGFVYQAYADLGAYDGMRPVIGSWLIGGAPAGLGIRETPGYITNNTACFAPHVVR